MLEELRFLDLLVPNRHNLGVKYHLVHVLHIIELIVKHLLSSGQQSFGSLPLLEAELRRLFSFLPLLVEHGQSLLLHLSLLKLLIQRGLLLRVIKCDPVMLVHNVLFDLVEFLLSQDQSIRLLILLRLSSYLSQLL